MFRKLHYWLIRLLVGKTPVIMNVHFLEGFVLAKEHLKKDTLVANCFLHRAGQSEIIERIRDALGAGQVPFVRGLMMDETEANETERIDRGPRTA